MNAQTAPEVYVPPVLLEVGEFSEDTLGSTGYEAEAGFAPFP